MSVTIRDLPTLSPLSSGYLIELDNASVGSPLSGKTTLGALADLALATLSIQGTSGEISVDNTNPESPIISFDANVIVSGGNSFGFAISTGTNDNFNYNILTNGVSRFSIDTSGNIFVSNFSSNAGVVHAASSGELISSLIVNNDIQNSTINLTTKVTGILPGSNGGTGINNGSNTLTVSASCAINQDLTTTSSPTFNNIDINSAVVNGLSASQVVITDSSKNLSSLAYTPNSIALSLMQRDASGKVYVGGIGYNGSASGQVNLSAATTGAVYSLVLPAAQGSAGTFMQNDGAGNLTWTTSTGAGDILNGGNSFTSNISIGSNDNFGLSLKTNNATRISLSNAGAINFPTLTASRVILTDGSSNLTTSLYDSANTASSFVVRDSSGKTNLSTLGLVGGSSGQVNLSAASTGATYNLFMPNAQGAANTFLINDGSGNLSWSTASGIGDILNGGNSFGALINIGTNDNYALNLRTNSITRMNINNSGDMFYTGAAVFLSGSSSSFQSLNSGYYPMLATDATTNSAYTYINILDDGNGASRFYSQQINGFNTAGIVVNDSSGNLSTTQNITTPTTISNTLTGAYHPTRLQPDAVPAYQVLGDANGIVDFTNTVSLMDFVLLDSIAGSLKPGFATEFYTGLYPVRITAQGSDTLVAPASNTVAANSYARVELLQPGFWVLTQQVQSISAGPGITVSNTSGVYTVSATGTELTLNGTPNQISIAQVGPMATWSLPTTLIAPGTFQAIGNTILNTGTGVLHSDASGNVTSSTVSNSDITNSTIDLTAKVTNKLPIANGGTNLSSIVANELLYGLSTNNISQLSTANNGTLVTSSSGVPSISSTLPSAVQGNITSLGTIGTGTWQGTTVGSGYGGTGTGTYAQGDLLYASAINTLSKLNVGSNGYVLASNGVTPVWVNPNTFSVGTANQIQTTTTSANAVYYVPFVPANSTSAQSMYTGAGLQYNPNYNSLGVNTAPNINYSMNSLGPYYLQGTLTGAYQNVRSQAYSGAALQTTADANGIVNFTNGTVMNFTLLYTLAGAQTPGFTTTLFVQPSAQAVTVVIQGSDTLISSGGAVLLPGETARVRLIQNGVWQLERVVQSIAAGTGISVADAAGTYTVTNTGVTSLTGTANQVIVSASTGGVTLSLPQAIGTASAPYFASIGAGTAAMNGPTQATYKYLLAGQEFFQSGNTSSSGAAVLLGTNRTNNRQIWFADSAQLTQNTTNSVIQFGGYGASLSPFINAVSTDTSTAFALRLQTSGGALSTGGTFTSTGNIIAPSVYGSTTGSGTLNIGGAGSGTYAGTLNLWGGNNATSTSNVAILSGSYPTGSNGGSAQIYGGFSSTASNNLIYLGYSGYPQTIYSYGSILPGSDNTYSIGATGARLGSIYYANTAFGNYLGFAGQTSFNGNTVIQGPNSVTAQALGYAWGTYSDDSLKEMIVDTDPEMELETLMSMRTVSYMWKPGQGDNIEGQTPGVHLGFIAQDVLQYMPEVVLGDEEDGYGLDYARLSRINTGAIKALYNRITAIEEQLGIKNKKSIKFREFKAEVLRLAAEN